MATLSRSPVRGVTPMSAFRRTTKTTQNLLRSSGFVHRVMGLVTERSMRNDA